jgi:hypothetical protein
MRVEDSSWRPGVGFDYCDGANSRVVEGEELRNTAEYHEHGNDEVHNTTANTLAIIHNVFPLGLAQQAYPQVSRGDSRTSLSQETYKMSEKSMMVYSLNRGTESRMV